MSRRGRRVNRGRFRPLAAQGVTLGTLPALRGVGTGGPGDPGPRAEKNCCAVEEANH